MGLDRDRAAHRAFPGRSALRHRVPLPRAPASRVASWAYASFALQLEEKRLRSFEAWRFLQREDDLTTCRRSITGLYQRARELISRFCDVHRTERDDCSPLAYRLRVLAGRTEMLGELQVNRRLVRRDPDRALKC